MDGQLNIDILGVAIKTLITTFLFATIVAILIYKKTQKLNKVNGKNNQPQTYMEDFYQSLKSDGVINDKRKSDVPKQRNIRDEHIEVDINMLNDENSQEVMPKSKNVNFDYERGTEISKFNNEDIDEYLYEEEEEKASIFNSIKKSPEEKEALRIAKLEEKFKLEEEKYALREEKRIEREKLEHQKREERENLEIQKRIEKEQQEKERQIAEIQKRKERNRIESQKRASRRPPREKTVYQPKTVEDKMLENDDFFSKYK